MERLFSDIESALQTVLINILNFAGSVTIKMGEKIRKALMQLFCISIPFYFLIIYSGAATAIGLRTQLSRHLVGIFLMLPIILFSIDRKLKLTNWRKSIFVPMVLSGVSILIISFIHPVGSGYRVFALMLIFLFPALALVWNNRKDYNTLFDALAYAISIAGIVYIVICLIGIQAGNIDITEARFKGGLSHAGNLSQVYTSVFCSGLYIIIQHFEDKKLFAHGAITTGAGAGMLLLGQGRSCILACVVSLIAAGVFLAKYVIKDKPKYELLKIVISIAIVITVSICVSSISNITKAQINTNKEMTEVTTSGQPTEANDDAVIDKLQNIKERISKQDRDINKYSSGRINLWKLIAKNLNLLGNDVEKQSIHDLTQNDWLIYAHNVFLEISYRCGIPIGMIFMLLEILAGFIAIRYLLFNKKRETCLIFPILFVIVYGTQSLLDCAGMPFILESGLYYYFALIPMMDRYI